MSYRLLKEPELEDAPGPRPGAARVLRRVGVGLALLVSLAALATLYPPSAPPSELLDGLLGSEPDAAPLRQCASGLPPAAKAPARTNPWASLSVNETADVFHWLEAPAQGLNLTRAYGSALSDNIVYHIEAFRPRKADVLAYLEAGAPPPDRYALVAINHGAEKEPYVAEYLVGPLPVSEKTQIRVLDEAYHRKKIPYNARGFVSMTEASVLLGAYMKRIAHITTDLFDASATGSANDTLVATMLAPYSFNGSFRRAWVSWRYNVPGTWLHPVGFFQYIDISGTDMTQWKLLKVVYNHQVFNSLDDFVGAYENGTLKRIPKRPDQGPNRMNYAWSTRQRHSKADKLDLDHLPGPRSVSFAGLRFRVDKQTQYVSWMGWGLYLGFDRDMGLSLWDIRLRGERLIYELSPQEALAQYSGNDPMQSTTAWLDRHFGMGSGVRDLIPGYDCPHEAVFLPATNFALLASIERNQAICIFETDTGRPITRHTGYSESEFGATKGYTLTIRSIATVGNYDYLFDYIFQIDGTIEVRVSASGYLQGGYWEPKQEAYGTAIRTTTMGSLHDHVINFKVDLDVGGLNNSLLRTWTEQEQVTQPWFDDDWGRTVIQQRINREVIKTEYDSRLKYPTNFQGNFALVNTEDKNRWGTPRGYAIHPGYSPVHNTVVGSKRVLKNANWAKYNLAVSVRKDTEYTSSSLWNMNLPGDPVIDFDKFFDGESITQTDLVAWVNVGTHHLPQAEDSPNTRTNLAASSFFLTPLNYFDYDVSIDSTNAILVHHPAEAGAPFTFDDYGVSPVHCAPQPVPPFAYEGLRAYDQDGKSIPVQPTDQLRREAELFHRIKVEL